MKTAHRRFKAICLVLIAFVTVVAASPMPVSALSDYEVRGAQAGEMHVQFLDHIEADGWRNKTVTVSGSSSAWYHYYQASGVWRPPQEIWVEETIEFSGYGIQQVTLEGTISRTGGGVSGSVSGGPRTTTYTFHYSTVGGTTTHHRNYNLAARGYITGVTHTVKAYFLWDGEWHGPVTASANEQTWR